MTRNFVNGDPNTVPFNEIALDSPALTLQGTNSPFNWPLPLQGLYSILLQGGNIYSPPSSGASIGQTGQIPANAQSLVFWGYIDNVSFGGNALSLVVLSSTPSYNIYGADISAYEGQTGQLRFTTVWTHAGILDNVQFSTSSIPEPSTLALGTLGALLLGFRRWQDF